MAWYHPPGYPRLKPPWGVSEEVQRIADKSAEDHPTDEYHLPELGATEQDPELHMLWSHCKRSQITPDALKHMKRYYLEYIAAHSGDVYYILRRPSKAEEQDQAQGEEDGDDPQGDQQVVKMRNLKLQENAFRAKYELERRDRRNAALFTTFIAASVGALLGLLGGLLASGVWP